jgi:hypothetical protein
VASIRRNAMADIKPAGRLAWISIVFLLKPRMIVKR